MGYERKRGKLERVQRAAARRVQTRLHRAIVGDPRCLLATIRYVITLDTDTQLPPRRRPQAGRHDGPSAQPAACTTSDAAASSKATRILQPRVRHQPAQRRRFAVRPPVRRRGGHRSVHPRGVRRLSGSLRRGLVHRQGHLRRGRLRSGPWTDASRRTSSSATTCWKAAMPARPWSPTSNCIEEHPVTLRDGGQPAASLDPRRLADRRLAAAAGARAGRQAAAEPADRLPSGRSSTTCAAASCRAALLALLLADGCWRSRAGVASGNCWSSARCSAALLTCGDRARPQTRGTRMGGAPARSPASRPCVR